VTAPALAAALALAAPAASVAPGGPPRLALHLGGIGAFGGRAVDASREYPEFQETARLRQRIDAVSAPGGELGLTFAATRRVGFAVAGTLSRARAGGALDAELPHPLFFARPRTASFALEAADRTEGALHAGPVLFASAAGLALELGAGLSWTRAEVSVADRVTYAHEYPYDEVAVRDVARRRISGTALGFHVAGAAARRVGSRLALRAGVRYTRAEVAPEAADTAVTVEAGGVQASLALRIGF
jgi:hypothetical protein